MKSNVKIEFDVDQTKYDESNALLIPEGGKPRVKNVPKKVSKKEIKSQLLSKKKRKKLEKILERKNRKLNRSKLINDLKQYQVNEKEYELMPSTSVVQTTGKKRINELLQLYHSINKNPNDSNGPDEPPRKRIKIPKIKLKCNEKNFNRKDPNIVGLDPSSSSSEDEDEDENSEHSCDEKKDENEKINVINEEPKVAPEKEKEKEEKIVKIEKNEPEKKPLPKTVFVSVNRPEEIQKARLKLPILAEEHNIMEAIMYNPVVIICGETGSGKTTQIPQFLYEGGYTLNGKMIGITEPRRVAAISMSKRVKYELNLTEAQVSYQIRFEGNVTKNTKIKFMTDGILMKEIENDFLLSNYSAIVIDEAHERSLYSDILIGFLSRVVQIREKKSDPLKLIIMSATLRVEDFTENSRLFKNPPPVIKIDSRQFPVSVHFSKHTNPCYMEEAFKKICKIHSTSPPGGILVFVTGRKEVLTLCRKLKEKFPLLEGGNVGGNSIAKDDRKKNDTDTIEEITKDEKKNPAVRKVNLDIYSVDPIETEKIDGDFDFSDDESNPESEVDDELTDDLGFMTTDEPLYCLPLYSMMPSHKQALVFKDPPPDCRLCVIATNVAETSLTIPNIKYVVDTGKVKNKVYDHVTSISTYVVEWTSKASADQRAGRAGRTSAGHCYRLYSSAVFNDQFKQHSDPEILLKPVDDLLLQMKAIGIDNVINFPFPTQPNVEALISAEKRLIWLDALEEEKIFNKKNKEVTRSKITRIGKLMANFPVNPRYAKMLCLSNQCNLMPYTLAIISALTVQEVFLNDENETTKKRRRKIFSNPHCLVLGDLMALLSAIGAANFEGLSPKFCEHYGLRYNAMVEINKLRHQLLNQIKQITKNLTITAELPVPSDQQVKLLGQLFLCGFADHVAKRVPYTWVTEEDEDGNVKKKQKPVRNCYQSIEVEDYVFISPHSVLFNETPEYVAYHEVFESSKMYMRNLIVVQPEWLPIYASKHCTFSNPLEDPAPRYDPIDDKVKCHCKSTFGRLCWELPAVEIEYPEGMDKYRFFAFFLFKGDVLKWFGKQVKYMSTPAIIFTKSWSFVQPKVENVVKRLCGHRICSKRSLLDIWESDKKFLLNEYLEWIQESQRQTIRQCWPPAK